MTVFPDGTKERLHGHNYMVGVEISVADVSLAHMIEFAFVKSAVDDLCRRWREHVLLAQFNPHWVLLRDDGSEIEFRLCGQRYVLPRQDVLVLPIDNLSVEALSAHIAGLLAEGLGERLVTCRATSLEVWVNESPGQGASCRLVLEKH